MPGFNFQARFAPLVRSGAKTNTIRGREVAVGSIAYLFTGQRTSKCERLGTHFISSCLPIELGIRNGCPSVHLRGKRLTQTVIQELAVSEGFADSREMILWFQSTYKQSVPNGEGTTVYTGYLISWAPSQGVNA